MSPQKTIFRTTLIGLAFLFACSIGFGHDETLLAPKKNYDIQTLSVFSESWLADSDFVYGPGALDFDLASFLRTHAPRLLSQQELLLHWCGYFSINPKLVLVIMDMQSDSILNNEQASIPEQPFGTLAVSAGFENQLKEVLFQLYSAYYGYRAQTHAKPAARINAATFAIQQLLNNQYTQAELLSQEHALHQDFIAHFSKLFPLDAAKLHYSKAIDKAKLPKPGFLQLPWQLHKSWHFNGVHTTTGSDPGILSSIDLTKSWGLVWGDNTNRDFVVAAHNGIVSVFSGCFVRVTSASGWSTNYYHLANLKVVNGAKIKRNQILGVYAGDKNQALCLGGSSTGPHVHFSLLNNGEFFALNGVNLSGYRIHSGRFSYDSDPSHMWLEKNGNRYYPYQNQLANTPATQ